MAPVFRISPPWSKSCEKVPDSRAKLDNSTENPPRVILPETKSHTIINTARLWARVFTAQRSPLRPACTPYCSSLSSASSQAFRYLSATYAPTPWWAISFLLPASARRPKAYFFLLTTWAISCAREACPFAPRYFSTPTGMLTAATKRSKRGCMAAR